MKKIILSALLIMSSTLYAEPFDATRYPGLYDGHADSTILHTADQPSSGDSYGSILVDIGHPLDW
jgi:hypothetical protein